MFHVFVISLGDNLDRHIPNAGPLMMDNPYLSLVVNEPETLIAAKHRLLSIYAELIYSVSLIPGVSKDTQGRMLYPKRIEHKHCFCTPRSGGKSTTIHFFKVSFILPVRYPNRSTEIYRNPIRLKSL